MATGTAKAELIIIERATIKPNFMFSPFDFFQSYGKKLTAEIVWRKEEHVKKIRGEEARKSMSFSDRDLNVKRIHFEVGFAHEALPPSRPWQIRRPRKNPRDEQVYAKSSKRFFRTRAGKGGLLSHKLRGE
jgi:hypothetical protein